METWNGKHDDRIKIATSIEALRNPCVRAVSVYRQKLWCLERGQITHGHTLPDFQLQIIQSVQNVSRIPLEKLRHLIEYGVYIPTFEEYVRHTVENQRSMINDLHFRPQHMFLSVTKVRYDYIIQMEFAQEISTNFLNKVGFYFPKI